MALVLALATPAMAQSTSQADSTECAAEKIAIEQAMDLARAKGQMLRRRQLGEALAAAQARCETLASQQSRATNIEQAEQRVRELREALDRAEEQLRRLKDAAS